jgi:hypothetical protein
MNPKQKAEELFKSMVFHTEYNCQPSIVSMVARECAIVAVNEIIKTIDFVYDTNNFEFWKEVKEHLIHMVPPVKKVDSYLQTR